MTFHIFPSGNHVGCFPLGTMGGCLLTQPRKAIPLQETPLWQGPAEQRSLLTPLKFQASLLGLLQNHPENKRRWEELGPWRRMSSPPVMPEYLSLGARPPSGLPLAFPHAALKLSSGSAWKHKQLASQPHQQCCKQPNLCLQSKYPLVGMGAVLRPLAPR